MGYSKLMGSLFVCPGLALLHAASPPQLELVSKSYTNAPRTFGDSIGVELSGDAKWAVFTSSGFGLTSVSKHPGIHDVYLRNLQTGEITQVSRNAAGESGNGHSIAPAISSDGQHIAFQSVATNLVPDDTNGVSDIFLFERSSGALKRISEAPGNADQGASTGPSVTPDGRFILFESNAALSSNDTNLSADLYLYDTPSGTSTLVTIGFDNNAVGLGLTNLATGYFLEQMSADARYIVFQSVSTNLVQNTPLPPRVHLFLRDMLSQTTSLLSESETSLYDAPVVAKNGDAVAFVAYTKEGTVTRPFLYHFAIPTKELTLLTNVAAQAQLSISADGQQIAIGDSGQVYLFDVASQQKQLISAAPDGAPGSLPSTSPIISDDGNTVVFTSAATNLVAGVTTNNFQLYRYERVSERVTLLSPGLTGGGADNDVLFPDTSSDATVAGFTSFARNLAPPDENAAADVFAILPVNDITVLSTPAAGLLSRSATGKSELISRSLSSNGRILAFTSNASDLVEGDTNGNSDVFVHDLRSGTIKLASVSSDGVHPFPAQSRLISLSASGDYLAFVVGNSLATNARIFVYDVAAGTNFLASVAPDGTPATNVTAGALSADGRFLAFSSPTSDSGYGIVRRDLQNGTSEFLTYASYQDLLISPGGRWILGLYSRFIFDALQKTNVIRAVYPFESSFVTDENTLLVNDSSSSIAQFGLYSLDSGIFSPIDTRVLAGAISADGSTVFYVASRSNNIAREAFFYDVASAARFPLNLSGAETNLNIRGTPALSENGQRLIFASTNSFAGIANTNRFANIYLYDRQLSNLTLISQSSSGAPGGFPSNSPQISAGGTVLAFASSAPDLVPGDFNSAQDIFLTTVPGTAPSRPKLMIRASEGNLLLDFSEGTGKLQEAPDPSGPWTNVPDIQLPHSEPIHLPNRRKYFRAIKQD